MLAAEQGADGVEFDVQLTADGHVVLIHDDNIQRTSSGFGRVAELTLEQLRYCEFSNGFVGFRNVRIPTLEEALEALRPTGLGVNIELKNTQELYPGLEDKALEIVTAAGMLERVIFSSFNHVSLANLRGRVAPENIGLLYSDGLLEPWNYAATVGAGALHPHHTALRQPGYVEAAHGAGMRVNTWTVDRAEDFRKFEAMGVDAVVTNMPDKLRSMWG